MIPGNINTDLISGADEAAYQISRSLRFNSSDSAFCSRVFSTPTDAKIGTFSFWCKRSKLGSGAQTILQQDSNSVYLGFDNNLSGADTFGVYLHNNTTKQARVTSQVFRDPSSWYHFVLAIDTTQGTASERLKFYVNGSQITTFSTSNTVDQNINVFSSGTYRIGSYAGSAEFLGGYLADIHFIDGQALTPSSFAETNATTGQWVPKAYTGSYGTNGFRLDFSDNSAATATTLGKDRAGSNNWTPNNLSVTAGAGNDSLVDTPTSYGTDAGNGGEVRGNYCTLNPLDNGGGTLSNGNLDFSNLTTAHRAVRSTIALPNSGKFYAELTVGTTNSVSVGVGFGFATQGANLTNDPANTGKWSIYLNGIRSQTTTVTSGLGYFQANDILQIAYDGATGNAWVGKNNVWYNSTGGTTGNPGAGTNPTFTLTDSVFPYCSLYNATAVLNGGARAFAYTAPSGFKALCDTSLPAPTIARPSTVMDVKLYTGNGSTQTISGLGFTNGDPDLVWIKDRSAANYHVVQDAVRGFGDTKNLNTNTTLAEGTDKDGVVKSTTSTGFVVGNGGTGTSGTNNNGEAYVAWTWDAGSSTVTNTQGSITSQVRANASAGFSVVSFTGAGGSQTVGHGLGVTPAMIIAKNRATTNSWAVWFTGFTANEYLVLNSTGAKASFSSQWGSTPTSTVFGVADSSVNGSGNGIIAYCFAPVAGYSAFGSYTGNGSADGPFVWCGFRPRWVLLKSSSAAGESWFLLDTSRSPYNVSQEYLMPNSSAGETSAYTIMDILSNGFKLKTSGGGSAFNGSGATYIYAAFAENPFQYARAR